MNRAFFHPLSAFALVAGTACTSVTARTASTAWTPADSTMPSRAQCKAATSDNQMTCYQTLLSSVLKTKGMDSAMAVLTSLAGSEENVRANGHMFAHTLGLTA